MTLEIKDDERKVKMHSLAYPILQKIIFKVVIYSYHILY